MRVLVLTPSHVAIAVAIIVATACPNVAQAQEASNSKANATEGGEIIVTATRRQESIKDVPISIAAFNNAQLDKLHVTSINELNGSVSNVVFQGAVGGNPTPIIRGITSNVRNAGTDSGVAAYVDGVYTGRPDSLALSLDDVQSVEVLKGPQGSLYGKNAIAGALSVKTNDPVFDLSGRVSAEVGNLGHYRGAVTINAPIVDQTAAFRFTVFGNNTDGFVRNLAGTPFKRAGTDNYWGGRAKLKIILSPSADLMLQADYRKANNTQYNSENLAGVDPSNRAKPVIAPGPFTVNNRNPQVNNRTNYGFAGTLNVDVGSGLSLTSITAYRKSDLLVRDSQDFSQLDAINTLWKNRSSQFTQEIRLSSPSGRPVEFTVGGFYFHQRLFQQNAGLLGPDFLRGSPFANTSIVPTGIVTNDSISGYLDINVKLFSGLTAFGSARVTREVKKANFSVVTDPGAALLFYNIPAHDDELTATDVSPTLGLRYALSDRVNVYAKVARGFKSGGWNLDFIGRTAAPAPRLSNLSFQPEKVTSYEIGLKGDAFDRHLRFGAAAYIEDYSNLQVVQFLGFGGGNVTSNAAKARIEGIEADINYNANGFEIGGSLGYNHARYTDYPGADPAGTNAAGKRLFGPKLTGELHAGYSIELGANKLGMFAQMTHIGDSYSDVLNTSRLRVPAVTLVNASADFGASDGNWNVRIWARNLLNRTYAQLLQNDVLAVILGGGTETNVSYGQPRTFGATFTKSF